VPLLVRLDGARGLTLKTKHARISYDTTNIFVLVPILIVNAIYLNILVHLEVLLYSRDDCNIKPWFLHQEELLAWILSFYHRGVWNHCNHRLNGLHIDKLKCCVALIITRPQGIDR
jgi:hypothetical protein